MVDILLVERLKLFRDGIRAIIKDQDIRIVGETDDGSAAVGLIKKTKPLIVVTDVKLVDGFTGIDLTSQIAEQLPGVRTVILSSADDGPTVVKAFKAGARGYILKQCGADDLLECLRVVAKGTSYLSPLIKNMLSEMIANNKVEETNAPPSALGKLNRKEIHVLRLIAQGKQNKEIADMMGIANSTVRSYRKSLMKKTHFNTVADLTKLAIRTGLFNLEEVPNVN